jgi:RNA polymerase sigma-70 factor (ECF subfamily)
MTKAEWSDDDLMLAYAAGDQASFARLYERYRGRVYRYFKRQLAGAEADDCFQILWLKIIDQAGGYRPAGVFDRYLFTLAHHVLVDHQRQRGRLAAVTDADAHAESVADGHDGGSYPDPAPEVAVARDELRRRLYALLDRLPFHQREVWILKQEAAMSIEEIATITSSSIEGVRSRLRYATSKLKSGLARYV